MPEKQPAMWSDFLTAINQITAVLIIVCALAGPAQAYVKGEKKFVFVRFLVEVVTSALSGIFIFLLLRVYDMPEEWLAAFTGIGTLFGLKVIDALYAFFMGRIKFMFHHELSQKIDLTNERKMEGKNE